MSTRGRPIGPRARSGAARTLLLIAAKNPRRRGWASREDGEFAKGREDWPFEPAFKVNRALHVGIEPETETGRADMKRHKWADIKSCVKPETRARLRGPSAVRRTSPVSTAKGQRPDAGSD